jgi:hypothetical protein
MTIFYPRKASDVWPRHPYGSAVRVQDWIYVPIPKCASTWTKELWKPGYECDFVTEQQSGAVSHVVILRDPVERWISGFAQCQVGNDPTCKDHWQRLGWDWVFDTVVFDNHTEPQSSFLAGIELDRVTWFQFGPDLETNMLAWFRDQLGMQQNTAGIDRYRAQDQAAPVFRNGMVGISQTEIMHLARQQLDQRPATRQQLQDCYQEDQDLFDSVTFYTC